MDGQYLPKDPEELIPLFFSNQIIYLVALLMALYALNWIIRSIGKMVVFLVLKRFTGTQIDNKLLFDMAGRIANLRLFQVLELISYFVLGVNALNSKKTRLSFMVNFAMRVFDLLAENGEKTFFHDVNVKLSAFAAQSDENALMKYIASLFSQVRKVREVDLRTWHSRIMTANGVMTLIKHLKDIYYFFFPPTNDTYVRVKSWISRAQVYLKNKPTSFTPKERQEMHELETERLTLREIFYHTPPAHKNYPPMFAAISADFAKFYSSSAGLLRDKTTRIKPVSMVFGTEAGVGKSEFSLLMQKFLTRYLYGKNWDETSQFVYNYNKNVNGRADGLTGNHSIIVMDDILQSVKVSEVTPEAILWCRFASKDAFFPDVAAIEDKRVAEARNHFTIATTNLSIHEDMNLGLQRNEAFLRRIDFQLEFPPLTKKVDNVTFKDFGKLRLVRKFGEKWDEEVTVDQFIEMVLDRYTENYNAWMNEDDTFAMNDDFLERFYQRTDRKLIEMTKIKVEEDNKKKTAWSFVPDRLKNLFGNDTPDDPSIVLKDSRSMPEKLKEKVSTMRTRAGIALQRSDPVDEEINEILYNSPNIKTTDEKSNAEYLAFCRMKGYDPDVLHLLLTKVNQMELKTRLCFEEITQDERRLLLYIAQILQETRFVNARIEAVVAFRYYSYNFEPISVDMSEYEYLDQLYVLQGRKDRQKRRPDNLRKIDETRLKKKNDYEDLGISDESASNYAQRKIELLNNLRKENNIRRRNRAVESKLRRERQIDLDNWKELPMFEAQVSFMPYSDYKRNKKDLIQNFYYDPDRSCVFPKTLEKLSDFVYFDPFAGYTLLMEYTSDERNKKGEFKTGLMILEKMERKSILRTRPSLYFSAKGRRFQQLATTFVTDPWVHFITSFFIFGYVNWVMTVISLTLFGFVYLPLVGNSEKKPALRIYIIITGVIILVMWCWWYYVKRRQEKTSENYTVSHKGGVALYKRKFLTQFDYYYGSLADTVDIYYDGINYFLVDQKLSYADQLEIWKKHDCDEDVLHTIYKLHRQKNPTFFEEHKHFMKDERYPYNERGEIIKDFFPEEKARREMHANHEFFESESYDRPINVKKRREPQFQAQVSVDKQSDQVLKSLKNNMLYITFDYGLDGKYRQRAFGLYGHYVLVNHHALFGYLKEKSGSIEPLEGVIVHIWRPNVDIPVQLSDCEIEILENDLLILGHPKFGCFTDCFKHMQKLSDLPTTSSLISSQIRMVGRDFDNCDASGRADLMTAIASNYRFMNNSLHSDRTYKVEGYYLVDVPSETGDCGSIYFSMDPTSDRKLIGFHTGGILGTGAIAVPLIAERFEKHHDKVLMRGRTLENFVAQSGCLIDEEADYEMIPPGFLDVGISTVRVHMGSKSKIFPSPMQKYIEPKTMVAHRTRWVDDDGTIVNPPDYFWNKEVQPPLVPPYLVKTALKGEIYRYPGPRESLQPVLSADQALNGVPNTMISPLKWDSSAGFRLRKFCNRGKLPYVELREQEDGSKKLFLSDFAVKDIVSRIRILKSSVVYAVASDAQKDERYPKENPRKYRIVSTDDVADLIIFKMYFGALLDALRRSVALGMSQVGIDASGPDFDKLHKYLSGMSCKAIELDAKAWDFNLAYEVLEGFAIFADEWYKKWFPNEKPINKIIRQNLLEKYRVHYHIFGNRVYARVGGMFSGFPATAEVNGFCNRIVSKIVYMLITKKMDFDDHVRSVYYGDDMLATVGDCDEFNQLTFVEVAKKHLGMTWLTAAKVPPTVPYKDLDDCSFISRTFVKIIPNLNVVHGCLDRDSIIEICLWVRTKSPFQVVPLLRQGMDSSLREMALHGKDHFEDWLQRCNDLLCELGAEPFTYTYNYMIGEWKQKI